MLTCFRNRDRSPRKERDRDRDRDRRDRERRHRDRDKGGDRERREVGRMLPLLQAFVHLVGSFFFNVVQRSSESLYAELKRSVKFSCV